MLEALRARGIAALLARDRRARPRASRGVGAHGARRRRRAGAFPVAPDLVEALAELGELDEADGDGSPAGLAEEQEHPWGLASASAATRSCGSRAERYDEEAATELTEAAEAYGALGLRFDRARTLLASVGRSGGEEVGHGS